MTVVADFILKLERVLQSNRCSKHFPLKKYAVVKKWLRSMAEKYFLQCQQQMYARDMFNVASGENFLNIHSFILHKNGMRQ